MKNQLCKLCSKIFTSRQARNRHEQTCGRSSSSKMFVCSKCGKCDTRKDNFMRHVAKCHEVVLQCSICQKTFSKKSNLKRHSEIHKQTPKSNTCNDCGKVYSRHDHFITHQNNGCTVGCTNGKDAEDFDLTTSFDAAFISLYGDENDEDLTLQDLSMAFIDGHDISFQVNQSNSVNTSVTPVKNTHDESTSNIAGLPSTPRRFAKVTTFFNFNYVFDC